MDAAAACVTLVNARFDAAGDDRTNLNGEWVEIKNVCATSKAVARWTINDFGNIHRYRFHLSVTMAPGATLKLHTGRGKNTKLNVYWGLKTPVWNNTGNERAYLRKPSGLLVSQWPTPTPTPTPTPIPTPIPTPTPTPMPSLPPDAGGLLSFFDYTESETRGLWLTDLAYTNPVRITSDRLLAEPAWSRDGNRIAWMGSNSIWVSQADGGGSRQITSGSDQRPEWSPDGRWVLFSRWIDGKLCLMRVSSAGGTVETLTSGYEDIKPSFSPDGSWLVFSRSVAGLNDIYRLDLASRTVTAVTDSRAQSLSPTLSPDGQWIAYYSDFDSPATDGTMFGDLEIYKIRTDGTGRMRLTDTKDGWAQFPAWSPSGAYIAYSGKGDQPGIWIVSPDGSDSRMVAPGFGREDADWRVLPR